MGRHVPQLGETDTLIELLLDGDKYRAMLEELVTIRDEAAAKVAILIGAEEVDSARIKAQSELQMARETHQLAKAEAQALVESTKQDLAAKDAKLRLGLEMLEQRSRDEQQRAREALEAAKLARREADALMHEAQSLAARARHDIAEATTARTLYEEKLAKFRALAG